jgi:hypothetical protein
MISRASMLTGVGLGAGLTYFLDAGRGARRRTMVRDRLVHAAHRTVRAVGTTSRDALHRMQGAAAWTRTAAAAEPVGDEVLVDRVRARLGRLVSHPWPE